MTDRAGPLIGAVVTMAASDLRQRVRDRSVLIFGLAVPFALIVVFNLLFSDVDDTSDVVDLRVVAAGATDDELGRSLLNVLGALDGVTIDVASTDEADARAQVLDSKATAAIIVPGGFTESVRSGADPTVEVVTNGDRGLRQLIVLSVVDRFVAQVGSASAAAAAAEQLGLDRATIGELIDDLAQMPPLITTSVGEAADEQLDLRSALVAGQAAMFMFFTVSFGVIAYLEERDRGTLARLQAAPIPPSSIVAAKVVVSFVLGIAATVVLLAASRLLFGVRFGGIVPVAVLIVAAVTAATSLVLVVAKLARSSEQASMASSILAIGIGALGGSFFPISQGGWFARVSDLTPPANFIRGLGITKAGGGVTDLGGPLLSLAGFAALAIVVAAVAPQRSAR